MTAGLGRGAGDALCRTPPITRSVPIGPELELRVRAIVDPASVGDEPVIDVRLFHLSDEDWLPSHEGVQVPLHRSTAVADAIRHVATRAAQLLAVAPPRGP